MGGRPFSCRLMVSAAAGFCCGPDRNADRPAGDPGRPAVAAGGAVLRSEEHTSELQSLMRISYAVFCLKKKKTKQYHSTVHKPQTRTLHDTKNQQQSQKTKQLH